jgi:hypothetical protein
MKLSLTYTSLCAVIGLMSFAGSQEAPTAAVSEQSIRLIGPLPEDKIAETLKKGERNPFAERAVTQINQEDGESEDAKLRSILSRLPISGAIKDRDGRFKVLIGRRLLAEGDKMPWLLEGQTSLLRVSKVTDKLVEISWVEDQAGVTPRKVTRPVRVNQPLIEQVLQLPSEGGKDGGNVRIWVTPKGESYQEEPLGDQGKAEEPSGAINPENPPDIDLNHRPTPP